MPTIAGLRRRGVPASAIREFCQRIGVTKQDNVIEMNLLDFCIRQELESSAPRGMAVLNPLKVVITNYEGSETLKGRGMPKIRILADVSYPLAPKSLLSTTILPTSRPQVEAPHQAKWCACVTLTLFDAMK